MNLDDPLAPGEVLIPTKHGDLPGRLSLSRHSRGIVVFAHGSGSSRLSPRNLFVANQLRAEGMGTLLFDLLTQDEDEDPQLRFDVDLLAGRLIEAVDWLENELAQSRVSIGIFGASTGAAAAIYAAAHLPESVRAVVSRGGRPDLALDAMCLVHCPTLLIVGGNDAVVLDLNREALSALPAKTPKELAVVPGASHLFEEPGKLEEVARLAGDWFQLYLSEPAPASPTGLRIL